MADNPFKAPEAHVEDVDRASADADLLAQPRKNPAGYGWKWIKEGFGNFRRSPLFWVINLVVLVLLAFIPVVSIVPSLLFPMFVAGLMLGAYAVDKGGSMGIGHLIAGFQNNAVSLLGMSGLYIVGSVVIAVAAVLLMIAMGDSDQMAVLANPEFAPEFGEPNISAFVVPGLFYLALMIPLLMGFWFAPVLVVRHDLGAIDAIKQSFAGCLRNIPALLVYGIALFILMIVAIIPAGLGMLIMMPVMFASIYTSYKDIFLEQQA